MLTIDRLSSIGVSHVPNDSPIFYKIFFIKSSFLSHDCFLENLVITFHYEWDFNIFRIDQLWKHGNFHFRFIVLMWHQAISQQHTLFKLALFVNLKNNSKHNQRHQGLVNLLYKHFPGFLSESGLIFPYARLVKLIAMVWEGLHKILFPMDKLLNDWQVQWLFKMI